MFGTDLGLKQLVSEQLIRDYLAEAERERAAALALATRSGPRRDRFAAARVAVATLLLRAGSWVMPGEAPADGVRVAG